jgi:transcriptional regulator with XRE-family HTH domain
MRVKFEERIQLIRKEKGLSQEEFAEKLGVSRQAVAKWEAGLSYPDVDNLIAISSIFKISIDCLLKPEEDECSRNPITPVKSGEPELNDMIDFLLRAKKKTYAAGKGVVASSRHCSHDLSYEEGDYLYYDTYLGGEKFSGEEAVWNKGNPVYSMNYIGRVLSEKFSGDFLKEALYLVPEDKPFRGPLVYHNGDFTYHCVVNGEVEWYQGYEEIFLQSEKVYECYFHGGMVK